MAVCKFYVQGRCMFGKLCKNSHEDVTSSALSSLVSDDSTACSYFNQGYCREGDVCPFRHDVASSKPVDTMRELEAATMALQLRPQAPSFVPSVPFSLEAPSFAPSSSQAANVSAVDPSDFAETNSVGIGNKSNIKRELPPVFDPNATYSTGFHGVIVTFKAGVEVSNIEAPYDLSSLRLTDLPDDAQPAALMDLFISSGIPIRANDISVQRKREPGSTATIKFQNPETATAAEKVIQEMNGNEEGELSSSEIVKTPAKFGCKIETNLVRFKLKMKIAIPNVDTILMKYLENEVQKILDAHRRLESFSMRLLSFSESGIQFSIRAVFKDRQSAIDICDIWPEKFMTNHFSISLLNREVSVRYTISNLLASAIRPELDKLKRLIIVEYGIILKIQHSEQGFVIISVLGADEKGVGKAKQTIDRILSGTILVNDDTVLWDSFFSTYESVAYLESLSRTYNIHLISKRRDFYILIYGGTQTARSEVEEKIARKIDNLSRSNLITLTPPLLSAAHNDVRDKIRKEFGDSNIYFNFDTSPATMALYDTKASWISAHQILHFLSSNSNSSDSEGTCPICLTPPSDSLRLSCHHRYCRSCFYNFAANASIPFKCLGDSGACKYTLPILELRALLPHSKFQKLLSDSFNAYIRTHPSLFKSCPIPSCSAIYRIQSSNDADNGYLPSILHTCTSCLTALCVSCNTASHTPYTCEDYALNHADGGVRALENWKQGQGEIVKECPDCKTTIEKNGGCMHMQCECCKLHICWYCMEGFREDKDEGEEVSARNLCYDHINSQHGGIFDDDYLEDTDEDD